MKTKGANLKRAFAKVIAVLQICIGALLLTGTVSLSLTAYQTIRNESIQITKNLSAVGDALVSLRETYSQSATNLFGLTGTMDDISTKLGGVSEKVCAMGELFMTLRLKGVGGKWEDVGADIASISEMVKKQGDTIEEYRADGHEKTLTALSETVESLRHVTCMLDGGSSAGRWCGFVCVLGFCVSMLFIMNGALLFVFSRGEN